MKCGGENSGFKEDGSFWAEQRRAAERSRAARFSLRESRAPASEWDLLKRNKGKRVSILFSSVINLCYGTKFAISMKHV